MTLYEPIVRTEAEQKIDAFIVERVKRGIQWLDETVGPTWVDRIDPADLVMSNPRACICAQVFGKERGYDFAMEALGDIRDGQPVAAAEHGFAFDARWGGGAASYFEQLRTAWLQQLAHE